MRQAIRTLSESSGPHPQGQWTRTLTVSLTRTLSVSLTHTRSVSLTRTLSVSLAAPSA